MINSGNQLCFEHALCRVLRRCQDWLLAHGVIYASNVCDALGHQQSVLLVEGQPVAKQHSYLWQVRAILCEQAYCRVYLAFAHGQVSPCYACAKAQVTVSPC